MTAPSNRNDTTFPCPAGSAVPIFARVKVARAVASSLGFEIGGGLAFAQDQVLKDRGAIAVEKVAEHLLDAGIGAAKGEREVDCAERGRRCGLDRGREDSNGDVQRLCRCLELREHGVWFDGRYGQLFGQRTERSERQGRIGRCKCERR